MSTNVVMNVTAIVAIYRSDSDHVLFVHIRGKTFDDVLTEARHVGYQNAAERVEVWKEGRRADRRAWVCYSSFGSQLVNKHKLVEIARSDRVYAKDMPKVDWNESER